MIHFHIISKHIKIKVLPKKKFNILLLKSKLGLIKLIIFNKTEIKLYKNNLIFIFNKKYKDKINATLSLIKLYTESLINFYNKKFFIQGPGFFLRIAKHNLFFKFDFVNLLKTSIPKHILIKKYEKGYICYSLSKQHLNSYLSFIQNFKFPDVYKNKGIWLENQELSLKKPRSTDY